MDKGIRLSEKHGVNASLAVCIICGEGKSVVLFGRLKDDAEAPRKTLDPFEPYEPCPTCREKYLKEATLVLGGKTNGQDGMEYTGSMMVIKDTAFRRIFEQEPPKGKIAFAPDPIVRNFVAQNEQQKKEQEGKPVES